MPAEPLTPAYCLPHAANAEEHFLRWQAHVDAGRIGHRAVPDPAIPTDHASVAAAPGLRCTISPCAERSSASAPPRTRV